MLDQLTEEQIEAVRKAAKAIQDLIEASEGREVSEGRIRAVDLWDAILPPRKPIQPETDGPTPATARQDRRTNVIKFEKAVA